MRIGGRPTISAERALAHVDRMIAECPGLTQTHFARLAGVANNLCVVARRAGRIEPETEERLLAVQARHVRLAPPPEMPAHLARAHIEWLIEQTGASRNCVARAAGINYQTLYNIMKPTKVIVKWRIHHAVMTCTPEDVVATDTWTERWPTVVRLRALQANQWGLAPLGEQWGMNLSGHANAPLDSPIEAAVARRIKAMYEFIGDEVGPSPRSAVYAARHGFKPPIYYDEDMNLIEVDEGDDAQWEARQTLCILGLTLENRSVASIVSTLGCAEKDVSRARRESGIRIGRTIDGGYEAIEARPGAAAAIRAAIRDVHYRSTIDALDAPDLDYVALLAGLVPEEDAVAA